MKQFFKFFVVALALVAWMPAQAQKSVVKDVKKMIKKESADVDHYRQAQKLIVPALSHSETKDDAETWFVAGKVMSDLALLLDFREMMFGDKSGVKEKCHAFIDGYEYFQRALQLDSLKGKPKHSKDIWNMINGRLDNYKLSAMQLFIDKDYDGAYKLYDIFCDLAPKTKSVAEIAEARYYQTVASWQSGGSLDTSVAQTLHKLIAAKQYDIAYAFLDRIAADSKDKAAIDALRGFVAELEKGLDAALPVYREVVKVNPDNADQMYNLGRALCLKAMEIIEKNPDMSDDELKLQLRPIYEEALTYLNKAAALDPTNTEVSRLLGDVKNRLETINGK